jgi:uncharacterized protein
MRNRIRLLSLVALLLSPAALLAADLQKGLAAYDIGDYETALAECQPLADAGNADAQFCIGRLYANGFGVPMDDAEALKWYGLAAAGGHAEARYNLAVMHANGWGVEMNEAEAARLYRLAADQGFVPAQTSLAYVLTHGRGIEENPVEAYQWYEIAFKRGDVNAESKRKDLADSMTQDQVLSAEAAAQKWLENFDGEALHAGNTDQ